MLSLGDAWACMNPSTGRGISLGLAHAAVLRRVVRSHGERPVELTAAFAAATEAELVRRGTAATVAADNARLAQIDALRTGRHASRRPRNPVAARAARGHVA